MKSNGPKAFLVRTKWRRKELMEKKKSVEESKEEGPGGHECFILTSKHNFYSEDINIDEKFKFIANPS